MVRRKEYKRRREARRRSRKRHPISRVLKKVYTDVRLNIFTITSPLSGVMTTPFIAKATGDGELRHSGRDTYWDVAVISRITQ